MPLYIRVNTFICNKMRQEELEGRLSTALGAAGSVLQSEVLQPYTLHPQPQTLKPKSQTPNPKPRILRPTPETRNQKNGFDDTTNVRCTRIRALYTNLNPKS